MSILHAHQLVHPLHMIQYIISETLMAAPLYRVDAIFRSVLNCTGARAYYVQITVLTVVRTPIEK